MPESQTEYALRDMTEDLTKRLAEDIFRVQCLAAGRTLEEAGRILAGRDAEVALVGPRTVAEKHVRAAIEATVALIEKAGST